MGENQFGFGAGRSTVSAIYQVIDAVLRALDGLQKVGGVFCDLSRAFACVNHNILIGKLKSYGVREHALVLLESFLGGRKQSVALREPVGCEAGGLTSAAVFCKVRFWAFSLHFSVYFQFTLTTCCQINQSLFADDTTALTSPKG